MCEPTTYSKSGLSTYGRTNKFDPTRTIALRAKFVSDMNKGFNELRGLVRQAIVERDVLGLKDKSESHPIFLTVQAAPPHHAFNFPRSGDKVAAFMTWFRQQALVTIERMPQYGAGIERQWTNMYVADSYKRGVMRARYEMRAAGYTVPTLEQSGGIDAIMSTPFHADRVGVLYSRVFSELKGITGDMDKQVSNILGQGLIDGDGPALLARKLNRTISGPAGNLGITDSLGRFIPAQRRAMILARTEIIRAHHMATIQEYRNYEVAGVRVRAEWTTAGDDRVCQECSDLEMRIFPLDEIEKMIPLHPQCRCIALPASPELIRTPAPRPTIEPAPTMEVLPVFSNRAQAARWIRKNMTEIKDLKFDPRLNMSQINEVISEVAHIKKAGYIRGNFEYNLNVFRAKLTDSVGGGYQMMKHGHTGAANRPTLRIAGNYTQTINQRIKEQIKPALQQRQRIVQDLQDARASLSRMEQIPRNELTQGMRTMLEQERRRVGGLESLLKQPAYDEKVIRERAASRLFSQARNTREAVRHEFGHMLNGDLQFNSSRYSQSVRSSIQNLKQRNQYRLDNRHQLHSTSDHFLDNSILRHAQGISEYSYTNGSEYFAESWTLFLRTGKLPDAELQRLFEAVLKGGRQSKGAARTGLRVIRTPIENVRHRGLMHSADTFAACIRRSGLIGTYASKPTPCSDVVLRDGKWMRKGKPVSSSELERIKKLGIPPGWRDVVVAADPKAELLAIGMDSKGRWVYKYSQAAIDKKAAQKFVRTRNFASDVPKIRAGIETGVNNNITEAYLLKLEHATAIRAGSTADRAAKVKAYGLTTFQHEHVTIRGNKIIFDFIAKKGVPARYELTDPVLAKWLGERKAATKVGQMLFPDTSAGKVNAYLRQLANGKSYSIKDFRTYHATRIAKEELKQYSSMVLTEKQRKEIIKNISTTVSKFLHNTPKMALESYIDPMVWEIIGGLK